jgi:hypothetical protein
MLLFNCVLCHAEARRRERDEQVDSDKVDTV